MQISVKVMGASYFIHNNQLTKYKQANCESGSQPWCCCEFPPLSPVEHVCVFLWEKHILSGGLAGLGGSWVILSREQRTGHVEVPLSRFPWTSLAFCPLSSGTRWV